MLIGRGAGAEMRRTLGIAVFSGMLGVTVFGIFLTPVFFNVIDWLGSDAHLPLADVAVDSAADPRDFRPRVREAGHPQSGLRGAKAKRMTMIGRT